MGALATTLIYRREATIVMVGKASSWRDRVAYSGITEEDRRRILNYVLEVKKVKYKDLGFDRTFVYRLRKGERRITDRVLRRLLDFLTEEEFSRLLGVEKKLEALGIMRNGVLDYGLVIDILEAAKRDNYLKNLIAKWFYENLAHEIPHVVKVTEEHVKKFEKRLSAKSKKTREDRLRYLLKALEDLEWELAPDKLEEYIYELQAESPHKAAHIAKALKLFIKTVLKDKALYYSFKVPRPGEKLVAEPLTLEEVVKVAKKIKHPGAQAYFILLAETGLRPGEVLSLTLSSLDLNNRKIRIGKISETKRSYITFLHKNTANYLKELYLPFREEFIEKYKPILARLNINLDVWEAKLFPFKDYELRKEIYAAMKKALGRQFRLYDLRAFFAAYMSTRGVSPLIINILQGRLPPREFKILQSHYLPFTEKDLRKIYEKNAPCITKFL